MTMNPSLLSSARTGTGSDLWQTPPHVFGWVSRILGDGFHDPCPAKWRRGIDADGLTACWPYEIYVNPPYSKITYWVDKVIDENLRGAQVIMLVPARPGSKWFQRALMACREVCFLRGRLRFVGGLYPAPFDSALIYFGHGNIWFKSVLGDHGIILRGPKENKDATAL